MSEHPQERLKVGLSQIHVNAFLLGTLSNGCDSNGDIRKREANAKSADLA